MLQIDEVTSEFVRLETGLSLALDDCLLGSAAGVDDDVGANLSVTEDNATEGNDSDSAAEA